jgi:hypothetical protein
MFEEEEHIIEDAEAIYEVETRTDNSGDSEKVEIVYVPVQNSSNQSDHKSPKKHDSAGKINIVSSSIVRTTSTAKEEKFISVIYPQFHGKTKLQLIDEILDLKRRNDLLHDKVEKYEETINKLLE